MNQLIPSNSHSGGRQWQGARIGMIDDCLWPALADGK